MAIRSAIRWALLALCCWAVTASAQQSQPARVTPLAALEPLRLALDQLDASVGRDSVTDADLAGMRASLEPTRDALRTQTETLEQRFNDIEVRLKQIGAPPAPGAPAEDATIATERTRLTEQR
ncbi:MAG: hypothetical protein AB7K04_17405, partial [Pseudorhodoplanes sp.]